MATAILTLIPNFLRLRSDDVAGKFYLEWYNSATGSWEIKEQINASTGNWDVFGNLPSNYIQFEIPVPLGFIPTGQPTDSTGIKFESKQYMVSSAILKHAKYAYFESDLQQLTGGTVTLELYDYTAAVVRANIVLTATTKRTRSADIKSSLVAGNPVGVRFNVTTAGAASSVGGGCSPVLVLVLGVS